jgi:septum site-determining protein MinC
MGILVMVENLLKKQAFKLKGRIYTLTVIQLIDTDGSNFEHQLSETVATAPRLLSGAPVVLDWLQ